MSAEQNKQTAIRFLESMAKGTDWSLAHDDMRFWIPDQGYIELSQFRQLMGRVGEVLATPVTVTITNVVAEGDKVAIEFNGHATTRDGQPYDNTYHFLY